MMKPEALIRNSSLRNMITGAWMQAAFALVLTLTLAPQSVKAHEIAPTVATLVLAEDMRSYSLSLDANAEALVAEIGNQHEDTDESPNAELYNALRDLPASALEREVEQILPKLQEAIRITADGQRIQPEFDGVDIPAVGDPSFPRVSLLRFSGTLAEGTQNLQWQFDKTYGDSAFRIAAPGVERISEWLVDGKPSQVFDLNDLRPKGFWQTVWDYLVIGYLHILPRGMDHILFVIGLFLLSPMIRPLLWQVSAFTVAHTITIALGTLGIVNAPSHIVEPLIAASIILVAIENVMTTQVSWWRTGVVFLFGLLHGLGFAGVLGEIGLPESQFITALISFNVGVEIGQLTVLAICFAVLAVLAIGLRAIGKWSAREAYYRNLVKIPGSLIIAAIAFYWFLERTVWA